MTDLTSIAAEYVEQWQLRVNAPAVQGSNALVQPVRTSDGVAAVLKIRSPHLNPDTVESEHEHLVLRRWAGQAAVKLLRADPHQRVLLLERLRPRSLEDVPVGEACEVVAGLYRRLHVPAMPQLRSLTSLVEGWGREFEALPRSAPIPRRLVEQAIALAGDLSTGSSDAARVLHGNLDYSNVLAAEREPWLAIAPHPVNGDPHFELAPMLLRRWDELSGHVRDGVRFRFHALVDAAGFDEERARAWVVVRVVHAATRELNDPAMLTRYVALAKAVQD